MGECPHCEHYDKLLKRFDDFERKYQKEIEDLKRRLRYYENSNSPPSANSLLWKEQKRERRERANNEEDAGPGPGRKDGHEGVTHSFVPSGQARHKLRKCPRCGSKDLKNILEDRRLIVEIPEPQPCTVIEHRICTCLCQRCGSEVTPDAGIPERGMLGSNLLSLAATLWSKARLPIRKISAMLEAVYCLKISPACINTALVNVSESLQPFANRVRQNINRSSSAGIDETGMPINGRKGWVWGAVSGNGRNAFITVEESRGSEVLEKHFGSFNGIAVSDGWRAYSMFRQQRCWAHILREAKTIVLRTGSGEAARLSSLLKALYHDIMEEIEEKPPPNRYLYRKAVGRFKRLLGRRYRDGDVKKFVAKMRNTGRDLFTFVLHAGVDSTNNAAERVLREVVVHRKIRGLLRNRKGMRMFGNIMTAVTTWDLRGLNALEEFRKYL